MIAHISASPRDFSETLFTIQIASRVLRMKKKKTKVAVVSSTPSPSSWSPAAAEKVRLQNTFRQESAGHLFTLWLLKVALTTYVS